MNEEVCRQLDDYLLDGLPDGQRAGFEQHLRECETCRSIAEQQAMVDELLRSASRSLPVPAGLPVRVRKRIDRVRRRRATLSAACVAGAASCVLTFWYFVRDKAQQDDPVLPRMMAEEESEQPPRGRQEIETPPEEIVKQDPEPAVQISFSDNVLAVPVESGDPTITLIQVYPVAKTRSETQ